MRNHDCCRRDIASAIARPAVAMWVALAALTTCTVLAVSLAESQFVAVQRTTNEVLRSQSAVTAESELALATHAMTTGDWGGVGTTTVSSETHRDGSTRSTRVEYLPDPDHPLRVIVRVTITHGADRRVSESRLELRPRIEDGSSPSDVRPVPSSYDAVKDHSLVVLAGSSVQALAPCVSIAGDAYTTGPIEFFANLDTTTAIQHDLESSYGRLVTGSGSRVSPNPALGDFSSPLTVPTDLQASQSRLGFTTALVPFRQLPPFDPAHYVAYRLYEGGPLFTASPVGSSISNVTLGPTASNPLGVYYRDGNVKVRDNVTIIGTLACRKLTLDGVNQIFAAPRLDEWLGATDADRRPRQFAIACERLICRDDARAAVDGGVLCLGKVTREPTNYELETTSVPYIVRDATVSLLDQPACRLNYVGSVSLRDVSPGSHAILVSDGEFVTTHEIIAVSDSNDTLDIVGNLPDGETLATRIVGRRKRSLDIRGQLYCLSLEADSLPYWELDNDLWDDLHGGWRGFNAFLAFFGASPIEFRDYLDYGPNFDDSTSSRAHEIYGLDNRATFALSPSRVGVPQWQTPLFRPATGSAGGDSSYRWRIVEWNRTVEGG